MTATNPEEHFDKTFRLVCRLDDADIEGELEKLQFAVKYGADTVMDLSTGTALYLQAAECVQGRSRHSGRLPGREIRRG